VKGINRRMRQTEWLPGWAKHWARDSALLLFSQFSAVVATSLVAIALARNLGPSDWGLFAGLFGVSQAFSTIASFGVAIWLLRELAQLSNVDQTASAEASKRAGHLVSGAIALNVVIAAVLILATLAVTLVVRLDPGATLALVSLMVYGALMAISAGLEAFFRSRRQLRQVVTAVLIEKVVLLSLVGVAVAAEFGVSAIAVMYIVAGIARVLVNGINIHASKHVALARASFDSLKTTLRASMPFALNAASLNIIPRLDAVILVTLSTTAAGYFALGDRVLGPAIMIPWVMSSALYPFLAQEGERSGAGWKILGVFVSAGCLLAVVGIALSPTLVPLIFGKAYDEAVDVVQVMLLAIPFVYGSNAMLAQLYTGGRERSILLVTLGISALGTVAIVAGQLVVGATGAAGGYVLRQILFLTGLVAIEGVPALTRRSARRSHSQPTAEPQSASPPTEERSEPLPTHGSAVPAELTAGTDRPEPSR
jgi:O-antigen/teichoic acid export membrane protein